jgi:hypothetical protein
MMMIAVAVIVGVIVDGRCLLLAHTTKIDLKYQSIAVRAAVHVRRKRSKSGIENHFAFFVPGGRSAPIVYEQNVAGQHVRFVGRLS